MCDDITVMRLPLEFTLLGVSRICCPRRADDAAAGDAKRSPQQAVQGRSAGVTICATGGRDTSGAEAIGTTTTIVYNAADAAATNIERRTAKAAEACARAAAPIAGGPAQLAGQASPQLGLCRGGATATNRALLRVQPSLHGMSGCGKTGLANSCAGKAASWDDDAPANFAFAAPGCTVEPLSAWRTRGAAGVSPTATEKSAVERVLKAKQAYGLVGHGRLAASVAAAANGNGGGAGALAEEMKQEAESGKAAKRKTKGKGKGRGTQKAAAAAAAETATQETADASAAENDGDSTADVNEGCCRCRSKRYVNRSGQGRGR